MDEQIGAVRRLFQDLLAPQLQRLDEKVSGLAQRCSQLATEVERSRTEVRELWDYVRQESTTVRERMSRVEGRVEGVKEEIVASVKLSLSRLVADGMRSGQLPPATDH